MREVLTFVVLLGGAVGASGVLWSKAVRPGYRATASFFRRISAATHVVLYELQPNDGMSIKDRIARMDGRIGALEEWRQRHDDGAP